MLAQRLDVRLGVLRTRDPDHADEISPFVLHWFDCHVGDKSAAVPMANVEFSAPGFPFAQSIHDLGRGDPRRWRHGQLDALAAQRFVPFPPYRRSATAFQNTTRPSRSVAMTASFTELVSGSATLDRVRLRRSGAAPKVCGIYGFQRISLRPASRFASSAGNR